MDRSIKRTFSFHKRNKRHSRNPYCNRRKRQQQAIPNIRTTIPFSEPAGRDGKGKALQKPGPNRNWGHKSKPQRETRETGISYLTPLRALTAGEVRAGDRKWQKGWWTARPVMLQENIGNLTLRLSGRRSPRKIWSRLVVLEGLGSRRTDGGAKGAIFMRFSARKRGEKTRGIG